MATAWLRERLGTTPASPAWPPGFADLSDEDRTARISGATSLDELLER